MMNPAAEIRPMTGNARFGREKPGLEERLVRSGGRSYARSGRETGALRWKELRPLRRARLLNMRDVQFIHQV